MEKRMLRIGIDLDNTVINYDAVLHAVALDEGLIGGKTPKNKTLIRNRIRSLPDGDDKWQRIQALVYGLHVSRASVFEGAFEFISGCRTRGIPVCIVSHKTPTVEIDGRRYFQRKRALNFLRKAGFFGKEGTGTIGTSVYFASTRQEKAERIASLSITHFIDDLPEMYSHPSFPKGVVKILFDPHGLHAQIEGVTVLRTWGDIGRQLGGTDP